MTGEIIASVFTGITALVTAIGGVLTLRRRKVEDDERQDTMELQYLRRSNVALKAYNLASTTHMYRLEMELAKVGVEPLPRPKALAEDPDLPDRPTRRALDREGK